MSRKVQGRSRARLGHWGRASPGSFATPALDLYFERGAGATPTLPVSTVNGRAGDTVSRVLVCFCLRCWGLGQPYIGWPGGGRGRRAARW